MDRWTMEELEKTDDLEFAAAILDERARKLTPYSPLGLKLKEARSTLLSIKRELDKCYQGISDTLRENYIGPGPETAEIQLGPVRKVSMEMPDAGGEGAEPDEPGDGGEGDA